MFVEKLPGNITDVSTLLLRYEVKLHCPALMAVKGGKNST